MVVSWATGVQNDVEMQMANATMKGFGSAWPSRDLQGGRRTHGAPRLEAF